MVLQKSSEALFGCQLELEFTMPTAEFFTPLTAFFLSICTQIGAHAASMDFLDRPLRNDSSCEFHSDQKSKSGLYKKCFCGLFCKFFFVIMRIISAVQTLLVSGFACDSFLLSPAFLLSFCSSIFTSCLHLVIFWPGSIGLAQGHKLQFPASKLKNQI